VAATHGDPAEPVDPRREPQPGLERVAGQRAQQRPLSQEVLPDRGRLAGDPAGVLRRVGLIDDRVELGQVVDQRDLSELRRSHRDIPVRASRVSDDAAMSVRHPQEVGQGHVVARYVTPGRRYRSLLGGGFLRLGEVERVAFAAALRADAAQASSEEIDALFGYEWRARLTAAWLVGVAQRVEWRERVEGLLLASELMNAGQGYCFALARFGGSEDAETLVSYLNQYLPRLESRFDQGSALGALMRLDARLGTSHAQQFLAPDGLWERWVDALPHTRGTSRAWAETSRERIDTWCGFWDA
jgi:hypothetical protein